MKGFWNEVNGKNERITELSLKYLPIGFSIYSTSSSILNVIFCFVKYGYVSTDHLYYTANYVYVSKRKHEKCKNKINKSYFISRLPWYQKTVFGWIGLIIFALFGGIAYIFLNTLFILLFSSICNFHKAFYLNSERLINKLDELTNVEPIKPADYKQIAPLLCEIMQNGIKGKE